MKAGGPLSSPAFHYVDGGYVNLTPVLAPDPFQLRLRPRFAPP